MGRKTEVMILHVDKDLYISGKDRSALLEVALTNEIQEALQNKSDVIEKYRGAILKNIVSDINSLVNGTGTSGRFHLEIGKFNVIFDEVNIELTDELEVIMEFKLDNIDITRLRLSKSEYEKYVGVFRI